MNKQELAEKIYVSSMRVNKFSKMTNEELGNMLMNEVWDKMTLFTRESDIVQACIDRLHGEDDHE